MTSTNSLPTAELAFQALCEEIVHLAKTTHNRSWVGDSLSVCAKRDVFRWFVPASLGGHGWGQPELLRAYVALSSADLATTFVLTQLTGACRRLASSENSELVQKTMPFLVSGEALATLSISHLTTSRQHLGKPALKAEPIANGFRLAGVSPWVTAAAYVDYLLVGAQLDNDQQLLALVPRETPGMSVQPAVRLLALNESCTAAVEFDNCEIDARWLIAGPTRDVMQQKEGGTTGGLQTSALAAGLAAAAIGYLHKEAEKRSDLRAAAGSLEQEWQTLTATLDDVARGGNSSSTADVRVLANSLVLRATQSALVAAKGSGFCEGHSVGRWCQEALFFLVWSCPQQVRDANLCELAGGSLSDVLAGLQSSDALPASSS